MKSWLIVLTSLVALSTIACLVVYWNGWTLYYGDAESHLDIARRVIDSRTPGWDQIGTAWLPLPHLLMLPLVGNDRLWRSGLAGAIPSAACFVLAGLFLFAAVKRVFGSVPCAAAAVACFALNPNLLYLQSIPMTEAVLAASLMALLYCTIAFQQTQKYRFVAGAGLASMAASLTRYEGWFLIPFVALFFLLAARKHRLFCAAAFSILASLAPLAWMAYNYWFYSNPIEFYNGPYSAKAIQGSASYPGVHDWAKAWLYYRTAVELCAGMAVIWVAALGLLFALGKRAWWPLLLLALPPAFYVWSVHSSGVPIFVPTLWTKSYYNTRYALSAWPLIAFCAGAAVLLAPVRLRSIAAVAVALVASVPWLFHPHPENWICWKESQVNSEARRAWTRQSAEFLKANYRTGTGIFGTLGDVGGIFREAGIPFREVLQEGNEPAWQAAVARPDLFLNEEWAVAIQGDPVAKAVERVRYRLVQTVTVNGAPPIEIYQRQ